MNPITITQAKGYTAAWAAPEILQGGDKITREGDIFAFGMVVIEVGPLDCHPTGEIDSFTTSKSRFRSSREGFHSVISNPNPSFSRLRAVSGLFARRRRGTLV